jgi:hypothetical protein
MNQHLWSKPKEIDEQSLYMANLSRDKLEEAYGQKFEIYEPVSYIIDISVIPKIVMVIKVKIAEGNYIHFRVNKINPCFKRLTDEEDKKACNIEFIEQFKTLEDLLTPTSINTETDVGIMDDK